MWFGSSALLQSIPSSDRCVIVGQDTIEACDSTRNLGVQFDSEMSMRAQIAKTTQMYVSSTCDVYVRFAGHWVARWQHNSCQHLS